MIKFFRKYNKRILVIVTILLMIVFVGGSALSSLMAPNPTGQEIGQAFGKLISQGDFGRVKGQTDLLARLGFPWFSPWGFRGRLEPLEVMDYLLLLREADEHAMPLSIELARIELAKRGVDLNSFSLTSRVAASDIETTVANYLRVVQLWDLAQGSALPSELEVRQAIRDQKERINANIVELKSAAGIDEVEAVGEDELQAQLDKYKEQVAGAGALEFGYLIPDRVAVDYVVINTHSIELRQPVTEKMARRYWREHQAEFLRPESEEEQAEDAGESQVEFEGPVLPEEPRSRYYETFEEAREEVVAHLRKEHQLEQARALAGLIWRALREPWYGQPQDEAGFPEVPEAAKDLHHHRKVVEQLKGDIAHPASMSFGRTGLFAREEATEQEGIGGTTEDNQSTAPGRRFGQTTHFVQGLIESALTDDTAGPRTLALYEPAPTPMIDEDDNLYLYRVVEVEKRRPPTSIDEVRDKVGADLRALRAFEAAKARAEVIVAKVGEEGLKAAWEACEALEGELEEECGDFFQANPFPRSSAEIFPGFRFPVIVSDKAGARDDEGKLRHQITDDKFVADVYDLLDEQGERGVGVVEVPALQRVFAVELAGLERVTTPDYESQKLPMQQQLARSRAESLMRGWFSPNRIRARCAYQAGS